VGRRAFDKARSAKNGRKFCKKLIKTARKERNIVKILKKGKKGSILRAADSMAQWQVQEISKNSKNRRKTIEMPRKAGK
jgi:hypothetical protein